MEGMGSVTGTSASGTPQECGSRCYAGRICGRHLPRQANWIHAPTGFTHPPPDPKHKGLLYFCTNYVLLCTIRTRLIPLILRLQYETYSLLNDLLTHTRVARPSAVLIL